MTLTQPHHDPSERWVSNPTPRTGETVTVTVDVPAASGFEQLMLRTVHDGEAVWLDGVAEPRAHGTTWRFELACHNATVNYRFWCDGTPGPHWLTGIGLLDHDPVDLHDFRLITTGATPRWVPETVWYQIFPDRFASSGRHLADLPDWARASGWDDPVVDGRPAMTQIYGGDLDGIIDHLDHLVELGVGGIYLTPVFAGRSNHRYDAISFDRVDPLLGGDDALIRLRRACDRAGLRLISDLTLNHTGVAHDWFITARSDPNSDEAGFYYFIDEPPGYESWLGIPSLPKLDHTSEALRQRLYDGPDSVYGRFLREPFDLDGWRIDVANMTGRFGLHDLNALVRRTARRTGDAIDPDNWLVAEHFFDATADVAGDGWHGVMNYAGVGRPIQSWLGEVRALRTMMPGPGQDPRPGDAVAAAIDEVRSAAPWQSALGSMALLGSHDTSRWRSVARSDELARVGFGLLLALPGSPCFFYGDEIGLTGVGNEQSRRPMPWNRDAWDQSILEWYRSLIHFRNGSRALAHGGLRWAERQADALAFIRESTDQRLLIRATRVDASPLRLPITALVADAIELGFGDGSVSSDGQEIVFDAEGPSFAIWRLS